MKKAVALLVLVLLMFTFNNCTSITNATSEDAHVKTADTEQFEATDWPDKGAVIPGSK